MNKYVLVPIFLAVTFVCDAQSANMDTISKMKTDTVPGVVVYTGYANLRFIAKGNYHTYTAEATEVKCDTGIIYIKTEFGYLDLKRNYHFYPLSNLQPAHLKGKP